MLVRYHQLVNFSNLEGSRFLCLEHVGKLGSEESGSGLPRTRLPTGADLKLQTHFILQHSLFPGLNAIKCRLLFRWKPFFVETVSFDCESHTIPDLDLDSIQQRI